MPARGSRSPQPDRCHLRSVAPELPRRDTEGSRSCRPSAQLRASDTSGALGDRPIQDMRMRGLNLHGVLNGVASDGVPWRTAA